MSDDRRLVDPRTRVIADRDEREAEKAPIASALHELARRRRAGLPDKMAAPGAVRGYETK